MESQTLMDAAQLGALFVHFLILAFSGWILLPAVIHDWCGYVLTALTVVLVLRTSLNPLWLLGAGALAGMVGLV